MDQDLHILVENGLLLGKTISKFIVKKERLEQEKLFLRNTVGETRFNDLGINVCMPKISTI